MIAPASLAPPIDATAGLRRAIYLVLIAVSLGNMVGRILAVNSVDVLALEKRLQRDGRADWRLQRPFLSGNDRSRWCTVRALVEHGTFAIDDVIQEPGWDTIDMVKHYDSAGEPRLYSSKPPLLATLVAGEYWLLHKFTGRTLGEEPYLLGRIMLITWNVLPMLAYFLAVARLIERFGRTDFGKVFAMAAATWGTLLSPFAVVLNNHLPAAVCAALALDVLARIWCDGDLCRWTFTRAGLFAALCPACELPALSFFAVATVAAAWRSWRQTLCWFLPATIVVGGAYFGTNYLAHGQWKVAYSQRDPAKDWTEGNWYNYTYVRNGQTKQSYWAPSFPRSKVDQGEESVAVYALHATVGHHGVFSLTPIWFLSMAGIVLWLVRGEADRRWLAGAVLAITVVCLAFFITQPTINRNYGGTSSGFRWMFWAAPLWLTALLPAVDALGRRRWGRTLALILLAASALSAAYPTWNPWTTPWLENFLGYVREAGG